MDEFLNQIGAFVVIFILVMARFASNHFFATVMMFMGYIGLITMIISYGLSMSRKPMRENRHPVLNTVTVFMAVITISFMMWKPTLIIADYINGHKVETVVTFEKDMERYSRNKSWVYYATINDVRYEVQRPNHPDINIAGKTYEVTYLTKSRVIAKMERLQ